MINSFDRWYLIKREKPSKNKPEKVKYRNSEVFRGHKKRDAEKAQKNKLDR